MARLAPPCDSADPAAWDRYWKNQLESGWGFVSADLFTDDRDLIRAMRELGVHTVLCAGNGVSLEPRALAAAGFDVVALDVSPLAQEVARSRPAGARQMGFYLDEESLGPGGSVAFVTGDLFDPAIAPGPFDVIIERRTTQLYFDQRFPLLLNALLARLSPEGVLVTHCHDGGWRPPARPRHVTRAWWLAQGWPEWQGEGTKPPGRVAWPVTSTG